MKLDFVALILVVLLGAWGGGVLIFVHDLISKKSERVAKPNKKIKIIIFIFVQICAWVIWVVPILVILLKAKCNNTQSMVEMGYRNLYGVGIVKKDPENTFRWFLLAAKNGDRDSMRTVGVLYRVGFGVSKNKFEGDFWLEKAAKEGDEIAIRFFKKK